MPQAQAYAPDGTPITEEEFPAALARGEAGFAAGSTVVMRDPSGTAVAVPAERVGERLGQGFGVVPHEEVARLDEARAAGTLGQMALTGLEGVGRGVTFGLSDVALNNVLGPEYSAHAEARKSANPFLALGGELTGAAAPAILTGGESLAGKAAGLTPAGLAARGAAALEHGTLHGLKALGYEGSTLAGRVGAKALAMGIGGAAEGALFGGGMAASESALKNEDITAAKIMAGGLEGLEIGGLSGAALGGLTELATTGAKAAGRQALELVSGGRTPEEAMQRLSTRSGLRATGLNATDIEKLLADEPRAARIVNRLDEEGLLHISDSFTTRAKKIADAADEAGKELGKIRDALDKAEAASPQPFEVMQRIREQVLAPLTETPISREVNKDVIHAVEKDVLGPIATGMNIGDRISFRDWSETIRKSIDDKAYGELGRLKQMGMKDSPLAIALSKSARIIEDEVTKSVENAAPDLKNAYVAAKTRYSDLATIAGKALKRAGAADARNFFSAADQVWAAGGMIMRSGAGGIPAAATGLAMGVASKVTRQRMDAVVYRIAKKLGDVNARQGAAVHAIAHDAGKLARAEEPLIQRVLKIYKGAEKVATTSTKTAYARAAHEVLGTHAEPPAYLDRLGMSPAIVALTQGGHDGLAQRVMMTDVDDKKYLSATMPTAQSRSGSSLTPHLEQPHTSEPAMKTWLERVAALHDPTTVLEDIARGKVSLPAVQALKERRPQLWQEYREQIGKALLKRDKPLSFSQRNKIGIAFDLPADKSLDPAYAAGIQQVYADEAQQMEQTQPRPGPSAKSESGKATMTPTQRIALGE